MTTRCITWAIAWVVLCQSGCTAFHVVLSSGDSGADETSSDSDGDGSDGDELCTFAERSISETSQLDVLFVIDDSTEMDEEQTVLRQQITIMLRELVDPSDRYAPAIDDIHVGVVSTDLGSYPYEIDSCSDSDDGLLQNDGMVSDCQEAYSASDCDHDECPWLSHSPERPDDDESDPGNPPLWDDFGCISILGTDGCSFKQPLEASYQALIEQTRPGGPNEGFLREDSMVLVIYVTIDDDCSVADTELFDPAMDDAPHNMRCALNPSQLHPVERYAEALRSLRPGREDLVFVSIIAGIPVDGSWDPGDPLMWLQDLQEVDSYGTALGLSCSTAMGRAWPPVRLVELAYDFGRNGVIESICRSDWTPVLMAMTRYISEFPTRFCLRGDIETLAGCRMIETLSNDRECPHLADGVGSERTGGWQVDLGLDRNGQRQCQILRADYDEDGCPDGDCDCHVDPVRGCTCSVSYEDPRPFSGCLQGWFHRSVDAPCLHGSLELTRLDIISTGSVVRFECETERCP